MPHHQKKRPPTEIAGRPVKLPLLGRVYVTTEPGRNAYERLRKEAAAFGLRTDRDPVGVHPGPDGTDLPTYDVYGREDRVEAFRLTSGYRCEFALADVNVLGERSSSIRPKDHGRHLAPRSSRAPTRDAHSGGQHANRRYYILSLDGELVFGPYAVPPDAPPGFETLLAEEPPDTSRYGPWSKRSRRKSSPVGIVDQPKDNRGVPTYRTAAPPLTEGKEISAPVEFYVISYDGERIFGPYREAMRYVGFETLPAVSS